MKGRPKTSYHDAIPGPGAYEASRTTRSSRAYSMASRYKDKKPEKTPDPNAYSPDYKKVIRSTNGFSFGEGKKLSKFVSDSPGPGIFNPKGLMGQGPKTTIASKRILSYSTVAPGPGTHSPNFEISKK